MKKIKNCSLLYDMMRTKSMMVYQSHLSLPLYHDTLNNTIE